MPDWGFSMSAISAIMTRKRRRALAVASILSAQLAFVGQSKGMGEPMTFALSSSSFDNQGSIPRKHSCEGGDVAPSLSWSEAPGSTKSFVLIVDDPDAPDPKAPQRTWVHWVLYDISGSVTSLPEGTTSKTLPPGTREGVNDWKRTGYGGPCPPAGRHRFFHKVYALDVVLGDLGQPTKADVENAMKGHIIAQAQLVGTYQKGQ